MVSDHIINLLQGVEGHIVLDRQKMLDMIDGYLNKPEYEKRLYQAARRMALVTDLGYEISGPEPCRSNRKPDPCDPGSL
ncbi:MAG: hypothetical protein ACLRTA_00325 [Clostridia bacterium]